MIEERWTLFKTLLVAFMSMVLDFFFPIKNFLHVIAILAIINIFFGLAADKWDFEFKKAFKAIVYLLGYLLLLLCSFGLGLLMEEAADDIKAFSKYITWVMVYFYSINILRNWSKWQPENMVIKFLYWVLSFKVVDKIKFLGEFLKKEKQHDAN